MKKKLIFTGCAVMAILCIVVIAVSLCKEGKESDKGQNIESESEVESDEPETTDGQETEDADDSDSNLNSNSSGNTSQSDLDIDIIEEKEENIQPNPDVGSEDGEDMGNEEDTQDSSSKPIELPFIPAS